MTNIEVFFVSFFPLLFLSGVPFLVFLGLIYWLGRFKNKNPILILFNMIGCTAIMCFWAINMHNAFTSVVDSGFQISLVSSFLLIVLLEVLGLYLVLKPKFT